MEKYFIRTHPKQISSYNWNYKEEEKLQKKIIKILKRKKLPKSLEVSWVENLLEKLKQMPEHDYSRRYDVFRTQHPFY